MDWAESSASAEAEIVGLHQEIARLQEQLRACTLTRIAHAGELDRIDQNFRNLLSVYSSNQSLVAVSRIRKCLDGRYP